VRGTAAQHGEDVSTVTWTSSKTGAGRWFAAERGSCRGRDLFEFADEMARRRVRWRDGADVEGARQAAEDGEGELGTSRGVYGVKSVGEGLDFPVQTNGQAEGCRQLSRTGR
jgi:hypothetical protein